MYQCMFMCVHTKTLKSAALGFAAAASSLEMCSDTIMCEATCVYPVNAHLFCC